MMSSNVKIQRDRGLGLIVFYKAVKGSLVYGAGGLLLTLLMTGEMDKMHQAAMVLRDHVTNAVSLELARLAVEALTVSHVHLAILALFIDGTFTLFEGWALHRRFWWAVWLVLIGTSSFLPFEVALLVREIKIGRLIVFLINVAIVIYLARRTWREHHVRNTAIPES